MDDNIEVLLDEKEIDLIITALYHMWRGEREVKELVDYMERYQQIVRGWKTNAK